MRSRGRSRSVCRKPEFPAPSLALLSDFFPTTSSFVPPLNGRVHLSTDPSPEKLASFQASCKENVSRLRNQLARRPVSTLQIQVLLIHSNRHRIARSDFISPHIFLVLPGLNFPRHRICSTAKPAPPRSRRRTPRAWCAATHSLPLLRHHHNRSRTFCSSSCRPCRPEEPRNRSGWKSETCLSEGKSRKTSRGSFFLGLLLNLDNHHYLIRNVTSIGTTVETGSPFGPVAGLNCHFLTVSMAFCSSP
jgi:hypothetical protein